MNSGANVCSQTQVEQQVAAQSHVSRWRRTETEDGSSRSTSTNTGGVVGVVLLLILINTSTMSSLVSHWLNRPTL